MALEVDVAIVGGGGAGLSLLIALDRLGSTLRVAIIDPVHRRENDRTWCFWDGGDTLEGAVHRSWSQVLVVAADGGERRLDLGELRYLMVRSVDFYRLAGAAEQRLGAVRVVRGVDEITDAAGGDHAVIHAGGRPISARWVFDSRPAAPVRPGVTPWLQHFRGWTVRLDRDRFDPLSPVLMDFSVPQSPRAVAFGYVLPSDARRALVEYTQFSRTRLDPDQYDAELRAYLDHRWGLTGADYVVEAVEDGAIPMTDARFARRAGPRTFRIGTAGGATRPSTGYTFATMQRQAAAVALALVEGRDPEPPRPHRPRHVWMDAVLLHALDGGLTDGAALFMRLFDRNPPDRVLRFLDGQTSRAEDLALMRTAPALVMARSAIGHAARRALVSRSGRSAGR